MNELLGVMAAAFVGGVAGALIVVGIQVIGSFIMMLMRK